MADIVNPNIYDIFDANPIGVYWENANVYMNESYKLMDLFPKRNQSNLTLSWVQGQNPLPIAIQPSAYDTKASLRDKRGVSEYSITMPFFREADRIGEVEFREVNELLNSPNMGLETAQATINKIYDQVGEIITGTVVQAERMRADLLQEAKFTIAADPELGRTVSYDYNYDNDGEWSANNKLILAGTDTWTKENEATFDPVNTLLDAVTYMQDTYGVTPVRAMMNTKTKRSMLQSEKLAKYINPVGYANAFVNDGAKQSFLMTETGLTYTTYDKMFQDERRNQRKFIKDGYIILLPEGAVGTTWWSQTPEQYFLNANLSSSSTYTTSEGASVTTYQEPHPVTQKWIVSAVMMPSFEGMKNVYVLKVF